MKVSRTKRRKSRRTSRKSTSRRTSRRGGAGLRNRDKHFKPLYYQNESDNVKKIKIVKTLITLLNDKGCDFILRFWDDIIDKSPDETNPQDNYKYEALQYFYDNFLFEKCMKQRKSSFLFKQKDQFLKSPIKQLLDAITN